MDAPDSKLQGGLKELIARRTCRVGPSATSGRLPAEGSEVAAGSELPLAASACQGACRWLRSAGWILATGRQLGPLSSGGAR